MGFNRSTGGVKKNGDMRLFQGPDPFVRFLEHLDCDIITIYQYGTVTALLAHVVQRISGETSPKSPNIATDPLQELLTRS